MFKNRLRKESFNLSGVLDCRVKDQLHKSVQSVSIAGASNRSETTVYSSSELYISLHRKRSLETSNPDF